MTINRCHSRLARYWLASFTVLLVAASAGGAERVPGTKVTLEPPPGFSRAEQFPGFQKAEVGSSVMVNELSGPVSQLRAGLTEEGLASRGMMLLDSQKISLDGREALLLHVSQVAAGTQFEKWIVVFGDAAQSVMVVATFPQAVAGSMSEPMKQSVLSARWNPGAQVSGFEGLPFQLKENSVLKIANRISNTVILTRDGVRGPVSPEDPLLVVGASVSEIDLSDIEGFSRQRIAQTAGIDRLANIEGKTTTVDGLPVYELNAEARDVKSGTPIRIYQLVVADQRRYFLVQGLVGASAAAGFLPQFREIAHSLRRAQ